MEPIRIFSESFAVPDDKVAEIVKNGISTEQVLETGEFEKYGEEFNIDAAMLDSMVDNFQSKVIGHDPMINFAHERREAAGWVQRIFTNPEKTKLLAEIKWSDAGREGLAGKNWRYLSAEYSESFYDGSRKKEYGPTFLGAALTNIPFLRHMPAVVGLSQDGTSARIRLLRSEDSTTTPKQEKPKMQTISLEDHQSQVRVLATQIDTMSKQLADLRAELAKGKELSEKFTALETEHKKVINQLADNKREADFAKLLSEGKVHAAQKKAFMEGDVDALLNLAKPLNTKGKGHSEPGDDEAPEIKKFEDLPKWEQNFFHKHLSHLVTKEVFLESRTSKVKIVESVDPEEDNEGDDEAGDAA